MTQNDEKSPQYIIGARHAGLTLLSSIKGYASVLQKNIVGEMSDAHQKVLQVIFDCCETPWESWITLTELIEKNENEKVIEVLSQVDSTGRSYLERNFIDKSIASIDVAKKYSSAILKEAQQLSDDQKNFLEIIDNNCKREIDIWKEIAEHFS